MTINLPPPTPGLSVAPNLAGAKPVAGVVGRAWGAWAVAQGIFFYASP